MTGSLLHQTYAEVDARTKAAQEQRTERRALADAILEGRGKANGKDGEWRTWKGSKVFLPDDKDVEPIGPAWAKPLLKVRQEHPQETPSWRKDEQPKARAFKAKDLAKAGPSQPTEGHKDEGGGILKQVAHHLGRLAKGVRDFFAGSGEKKITEGVEATEPPVDLVTLRRYRETYVQMCEHAGHEPDAEVVELAEDAEALLEVTGSTYLAVQALFGIVGLFFLTSDRWEQAHRRAREAMGKGLEAVNLGHEAWQALGEIMQDVESRMKDAGMKREKMLTRVPKPGSAYAKRLVTPVMAVHRGEAAPQYGAEVLNKGLDYMAYWRKRYPGKSVLARMGDALKKAASKLFGK